MELTPSRFADTIVLSAPPPVVSIRDGGRLHDGSLGQLGLRPVGPVVPRWGHRYIAHGLRALILAARRVRRRGSARRRGPAARAGGLRHRPLTLVFKTFPSVATPSPRSRPRAWRVRAAKRADARPFLGTRGSIPVAPTSAAIQRKLVAALVKAAGRGLDTPDKARAFVEGELDFAVSHTFGGNSSCVEIETGTGEYVLCDMGTGARPFAVSTLARHGPPARPTTS